MQGNSRQSRKVSVFLFLYCYFCSLFLCSSVIIESLFAELSSIDDIIYHQMQSKEKYLPWERYRKTEKSSTETYCLIVFTLNQPSTNRGGTKEIYGFYKVTLKLRIRSTLRIQRIYLFSRKVYRCI